MARTTLLIPCYGIRKSSCLWSIRHPPSRSPGSVSSSQIGTLSASRLRSGHGSRGLELFQLGFHRVFMPRGCSGSWDAGGRPVNTPRPFVKWAGGKRRIVQGLLGNLPDDICSGTVTRYMEPFLGGGAVLFSLLGKFGIKEYVVNDSNRDLINTYRILAANPHDLIAALSTLEDEWLNMDKRERRTYYNKKRTLFNSISRSDAKGSSLTRAALLIFLNKTCWNGLYRLNQEGEFNVPMGEYGNPSICDRDNLTAVSRVLRSVSFYSMDFRRFFQAIGHIGPESLIYIDPPYVLPQENNGFLHYNEKVFSWADQIDLAEWAHRFASQGARVMVSNARHKSIKGLYSRPSFHEHALPRFSGIAASSSNRRKISELLLTSYPVEETIRWN